MIQVGEKEGILFQEKNFTLVKKVGKKGELIPKHNHPGEDILFTVVKGKMKILMNEKDTYLLEPGRVLHFDGENYIQAEYLEDAQATVTLILKK